MKIGYQLFEVPFATPRCDEFLQLRQAALRTPLNMEFHVEDIASEWDEHHLVCVNDEDQLLGGLMLRKLSETTLKMRQVVVNNTKRGHGIGKLLVHYSEDFAREHCYEFMTLHARETVHKFYLKLGYNIEGDLFEEVDIPHYKMVKEL